MSQSTDREALFFGRAIKVIKELMKHDRLLFQFTAFNAGTTMSTFDLAGLSEAIKPLRKSCGW